jgi:hypothetical protein
VQWNRGLKGIEECEEGEKQGRMMAVNEVLEERFKRVGLELSCWLGRTD